MELNESTHMASNDECGEQENIFDCDVCVQENELRMPYMLTYGTRSQTTMTLSLDVRVCCVVAMLPYERRDKRETEEKKAAARIHMPRSASPPSC